MKCSELMKTDVVSCATTALVGAVAEQMRRSNVGFVPVCANDGAVIGTLTDRDLVLRVLADYRDPDTTTAMDVMTRDVIGCSPTDDLEIAEQLMSKHKVSRILCVDELKRPLGVISLSDIVTAERRGVGSAVLRSVSQREASRA